MAYQKKKEFDPTIVTAKDSGIAHGNALNGASAIVSAEIAAGILVAKDEIDARLNELLTSFHALNVAAFDHERVGPAGGSRSASKAERTVKKAFKTRDEDVEDVDEDEDDEEIPYADMELKGGKYGGETLADVYEEDPSYVTDFLADSTKNKNKYTLKAAKAFVKAVA